MSNQNVFLKSAIFSKGLFDDLFGIIQEVYSDNKDAIETGKDISADMIKSMSDSAKNALYELRYSNEHLINLKNRIENQGAYYRELNRKSLSADSIILGGETLISLLSMDSIPSEVEKAYSMAYPGLSQEISFQDKVRELDSDEIIGFISGVKGKLFEQKYVEYLNDNNLPEDYSADLASSATQEGWDIKIIGPDNELVSLIQAKATDSISYVQKALEKYPNIDVVTTDEVYSHLIMSDIGENIINSNISNEELISVLNNAVDDVSYTMDFTPPILTFAYIAFTSYDKKNMDYYKYAKDIGGRGGKSYFAYLAGHAVAYGTGVWLLGVVGSIGGRMLLDKTTERIEVITKLEELENNNQKIIDRLKTKIAVGKSENFIFLENDTETTLSWWTELDDQYIALEASSAIDCQEEIEYLEETITELETELELLRADYDKLWYSR